MKQQSLFGETGKVQINESLKTIAKGYPGQAYDQLRQQGFPIGQSIYFVLEQHLVFDWEKLWNQFEHQGYMIYCDVKIKGKQFRFAEKDMTVYYNNQEVYNWEHNDIFDQKTANKIRRKIKAFIISNQYQFELK